MKLDEAALLVRAEAGEIADPQTDLPRLARDVQFMTKVDALLSRIATSHRLLLGDSRDLAAIPSGSVHLVVTSPPYWTLKTYNDTDGQLGHLSDYDDFNAELDKVWKESLRVLVPGGRLVCVVGDVCLSRRRNHGRHTVVALHSTISERCRRLGFDGLAPIIWHKISNAVFEANGNGAGFLGKPYEPNAVIKNDIEYILLLRKPGGYRSPSLETRLLSLISGTNHKKWFQQIWSGITGASTRDHPAPFPAELVSRLIRMFSFAGDTVLDPFVGTGTTMLAAAAAGRNSIGVEIDPAYVLQSAERIRAKLPDEAAFVVGGLPAAAIEAA
ncbi:MAG: site-specific DNA-methyltransferase [Chloroflexota bacterium]|nr:MAG: site-specific DNA-methyltransferase [Chloroflexota bacterium]